MSSAVTGKGVPVKVPNRSIRLSVLRLVRMAVAFVVVAGSLGLATVAATAQSGGSCPSDGADNYSDVVAGSTHANDIACLLELGIPAPGDTYRPNDDITRSEMARLVAGAYAAVTGSAADVADHAFTDVAGDPNEDDIARIAGLGITNGVNPEGTLYAPDDVVIRGHMALFLTRFYTAVAGGDAPAGDTEFTDIAERSAEQQAAIGQIFALGVTTGTTDTTYSPSNNVTRGQMASFVARMYRVLDALPDPAEAPGAPTGVEVAISGEAGDALDVSWTAPEESGTSDVTGYVVQWKSGDGDYSADNASSESGTSATFDGLTQGDTYTFRVAAVSDDGQSDWSDEASGTPAVAPGLVGELTSTPGNGTLTLSWTAPADDGGGEITGYLISWRTGRQASADTAEVAGDATGYIITGLMNSSSYSVWVEAINAVGNGEAASVPTGANNASVSPAPTAATAPQNVTVTPSDTALAVSWTAPADDGGTTLLATGAYTVERRCGSTTAWGNAQEIDNVANKQLQSASITGLNNGDACEVRVRANSYLDLDVIPDGQDMWDDDGNPSTPDVPTADEATKNGPWAEGSGTPVTVPNEPTGVEVTPAHQSLQITWNAPAVDGGSDITGYKVLWSAGVPFEATVPVEPRMYTITGLNNQYQYAVTIKTITAVGESTNASTVVTGDPAPVPAAPTNVQAAPPAVVAGETHSGTSLVVTWNVPPSNGTGAVISYNVQSRTSAVPESSPGAGDAVAAGTWSTAISVAAPMTTTTISSLAIGTSYDVRVQATNLDAAVATSGPGPYGVGSGTPATLPGRVAAATTVVVPGYTSLDVLWVAPAASGSDITHYLVRYALNVTGNESFSSDIRVNAPLTRTNITGLSVGLPYVIQIQAVNGIGTGDNPGADFAGTTGLYPNAPASVTAVSKVDGDGSLLTVTWSTVTQTNGTGPVASYIVETLITAPAANVTGAWVPTAVSDPTDTTADVVSVDGNTHLVRVRAVAGTGPNGSFGYLAGTVTAAGVPATPANVAAVVDEATSSTVNVSWDSIPEGTDTNITGYVVAWFNSTNQVTGSRGSASVSGAGSGKYTITGLNPGTYTVTVTAVNHVGQSTAGAAGTAPVVPVPS